MGGAATTTRSTSTTKTQSSLPNDQTSTNMKSTKKIRRPKLSQANTMKTSFQQRNPNNNIPQPKAVRKIILTEDVKRIDSAKSDGYRITELKPIWYFVALACFSLVLKIIKGVF